MQYLSPISVDDAVAMLAAQTGDCRVLAGGTDLLVRMKSGFAEPDAVMDIKRISDRKSTRLNRTR